MNNLFAAATRHTLRNTDKLPPLRQRKNPVLAFLMGFAFGPPGLAAYTKSWSDFLIPMVLILVGSVGTLGIAALPCWCLTGVFGFIRVTHSNKALDSRSNNDDEPPSSAMSASHYATERVPLINPRRGVKVLGA